MLVTCLLITDRLNEEAVAWFSRVKQIADQLVIFVRENRATPEVRRQVRELTSEVYPAPADYYLSTPEFRRMLELCRGNWILLLDHDEELSLDWDHPGWRVVLADEELTHYWLPRRWITPGGYFLDCEPWWPDWQARLFRNRPSIVSFPSQLHERIQIEGAAGWLPHLAIHHHDLRLASRTDREGKVQLYEELRPGHALSYFYLYEDYPVPGAEIPLPKAHPEGDSYVLAMPALRWDEMSSVSLLAETPLSQLGVGSLHWIFVTVRNELHISIGAGAPNPVNLSYHWLTWPEPKMVVADGQRTAILPVTPAKSEKTYRMLIIAPQAPGEYVLQITLVQEGVAWFEDKHEMLPLNYRIAVESVASRALVGR